MIVWVVVVGLLAATPPEPGSEPVRDALHLDVPVIRQSPERCGPAALAMVLRFYHAAPAAITEAEGAYDAKLRGALITDLAAAARRAGYAASIQSPSEEQLIGFLRSHAPPILLYERGIGPIGRGHYGVLVGWDPVRRAFTLNDGGARPRRMGHHELMHRWRAAGAQVLMVNPP